jgi:hypothetical protein
MELSDRAIRLLARLSRARRLYAECKGADLDALQELGLLQWFDARSSTTPFKEDPRPLFRLLLFSGRIDYFWVEPVENLRELVGPEVSAKVDAIDEMEWAVTSGPLTGAGRPEQTRSRPKAIARALAGAERHAVKTIADALGTARSNLVAQAATAAPPWAPPAARARVADRDQAGDRRSAGQPTYGYGRVHAPIRRLREEQGGTAVNVKRVDRVVKAHAILPTATGGP